MHNYFFKNKLFRRVFIYLFILLLGCAYYNTLFNAKKSFNAGLEIIQKEPGKETNSQAKNYFEQTIEKCWKLIELYSDKSKYADDAFLYIIKSEYYIGNYSQATLHANQFLSKYPDSKYTIEANLWLGKLLTKDNKIEEGKEYLNKVINLSKDSKLKAEALYELGNIAFEDKDYVKAIEHFNRALKEKIDKVYAAFVQYYLAESYFQQKQYKEAIERYKKVRKFSPSVDIEYRTAMNLAKSYLGMSEYEESLKILRKMLTAPRFNNSIPSIKSEIANIYYRQGKVLDAVDLYTEVIKEKKIHEGTAQASINLAKIYEGPLNNIDSAVFYYGQVKKLYSKSDSVDRAEEKHIFLSELKKIKDNIKYDRNIIYKYENDKYFRDSLLTAQYEDSIFQVLGNIPTIKQDTISVKIDSTSELYSKTLTQLDSIKTIFVDSLNSLSQDSLQKETYDSIKASLEDTLKYVTQYILQKSPKKEKKVERRKLPQIKEDLKNNEFHLAEFFLLEIQDNDSSLKYYNNFLNQYSDSVLSPKAIYSLYYIFSQSANYDSSKIDSLEQILLNFYPNSLFTREILRRKGLLKKNTNEDLSFLNAQELFLKAENFLYNNKIDSALYYYRHVAKIETNLIWSAKAQYAIAWIYEKKIGDINQAIHEYEKLKENYSYDQYTKIATLKLAQTKVEHSYQDTTSILQDTTQLASATILDETTKFNQVSDKENNTQSNIFEDNIPMISKTKEYRDWRRNRSKLK